MLGAVSVAVLSLLPASGCTRPLLRADARIPARQCAGGVLCAPEASDIGGEEMVQPKVSGPNWELPDVAVNGGLFLLLHTFTGSAAQLIVAESALGADAGRSAFAVARLLCIALFMGVQNFAPGGLPLDEWVFTRRESNGAALSPQQLPAWGPAAPILYATLFFGVSIVVSVALTVALTDVTPSTAFGIILPTASAPEVGRALDVLVAAPIQEETFFRAWLLGALRQVDVDNNMALVVSAILFALWHVGDATGLLELLGLGAYLAALYDRSGRSLPTAIATHASYNGIVFVLGALRSSFALPAP